MKKILVTQKEYKTIEKQLPFNVPTDPMYLFIYGIRISVKIVPRWYELKEGEDAAELTIIVVHGWPDYLVKRYLVNSYAIGECIKRGTDELKIILSAMNNPEERNIRTEDEFTGDLDRVIEAFKIKR